MKVILSCSLCLLLSWDLLAVSDPTKPDLASAIKAPTSTEGQPVVKASDKFKLSLIKSDQGQRMALINSKALKEGDVIDGYIVLKITEQDVVLQHTDERLTLSLFKAMKIQ